MEDFWPSPSTTLITYTEGFKLKEQDQMILFALCEIDEG